MSDEIHTVASRNLNEEEMEGPALLYTHIALQYILQGRASHR